MLYAFCQWPSQMCASVGRSLDNDNNNKIGLFSAFHGLQRRFREQTFKVVVVENHVTHRLSSSFHSTLTKTPSSPIAPAEKNVWRRHWMYVIWVAWRASAEGGRGQVKGTAQPPVTHTPRNRLCPIHCTTSCAPYTRTHANTGCSLCFVIALLE